MAIRPVLKMGHPVLRQVATPVERFDAALSELLLDMDDTMRAMSGAGIAAPQIGVGLRVVIFELRENPRYPHVSPVPYTVLVNPVLTPLGDEQHEGWEGCLSVPGMRGLVPRYHRLRVQDAIQVIHLVLNHTSVKSLHGAIDRLAVSIETLIPQPVVARHESSHPRHG